MTREGGILVRREVLGPGGRLRRVQSCGKMPVWHGRGRDLEVASGDVLRSRSMASESMPVHLPMTLQQFLEYTAWEGAAPPMTSCCALADSFHSCICHRAPSLFRGIRHQPGSTKRRVPSPHWRARSRIPTSIGPWSAAYRHSTDMAAGGSSIYGNLS